MKLKIVSFRPGWALRASALGRLAAAAAVALASVCAVEAQTAYRQHNLVSDLPGVADFLDPNLVNPWGLTATPTSPFWLSDNGTGLATVYNSNGSPNAARVIALPPPAGGSPPAAPSGIAANTTTNFTVGTNGPAHFIFSTEDGTISAWAGVGTNATLEADNSGAGTVYKGLALAAWNGTNYLYATDFHHGKVDVFDQNFNPVSLPGAFKDTNFPAGYAPFGIQLVGTNLVVTYALQDSAAHDDLAGPGNGYVDLYAPSGALVQRLISNGPLDSPWGVAPAPAGFGEFGGALLIGNFGDGRINAFNPADGSFLGALTDAGGQPVSIPGLWGLLFGNGGNGGSSNILYFTAGIPGPGQVEDHGLLGGISVVNTAPAPFVQNNLVSDLPGVAFNQDPNLVNPWGIASSPTSPFWVSDNGSGLSTLYNTAGSTVSLVVTLPPPAGAAPPAAPDGIVWNSTTNFVVGTNGPSKFIFSTEDGTISAWAAGSNAVLEVDNSASGTVYKGLALAAWNGSNYLYATDFHHGKVDVFDANFRSVTNSGAFQDPSLPPGFAPFGIQSIGTALFVTYAKQDSVAHDDVSGPGNGFVDVYDTSGRLINRLISAGALNSPWGLTIAPAAFGPFGGDLLVANFGDGRINAYDPVSGSWIDILQTGGGVPFAVPGLWGLINGNGGSGGNSNSVYFTAGIPGGGNVEDHGLFGSLSPLPPLATPYLQHNLVSDLAGVADFTDPNLVNPWGITTTASSPFWISDNGTGLSTVYNSNGAPNALVVAVPPPAGASPPSAPDGIVANTTTNFTVGTNGPAHFIFSTEDGTISAWAAGSNAVLEVDNSSSGTVYKGLALASWNGTNYLYATDFHHGKVDVFDANFHPVALPGAFQDLNIPPGFAPFGIQALGSSIYVTYAKQDSVAHDDVGGPGNGFVDVFGPNGAFVQRLISNGLLNSPWGLVMAPPGFGQFANTLLIGNFGDGHVNAFDAVTGAPVGTLSGLNGVPVAIQGLWGLIIGNGGKGGDANTLYFTAGIPGNGQPVESHGLFGSIAPLLPVQFTSITPSGGNIILNWTGGLGPFTLQTSTDLTTTNWANAGSFTNRAATVPNEGGSWFFRLLDQLPPVP